MNIEPQYRSHVGGFPFQPCRIAGYHLASAMQGAILWAFDA